MKKRILILVSALLMTGCAKGYSPVTKENNNTKVEINGEFSYCRLDEPFNGLDKGGVKDMREYLLSYKEQGKTILICSHSAEDISVLCETVHEMDKGVISKIGK